MTASWGLGITSHLIKQDATGDADTTTINLGSAQTGFRTFETIGYGWVFYWLEKGSDYEYGYAYVNAAAHTLQREAGAVIFSSTSALITAGATDAVVVSCPANPLSFGRQGASVIGLDQSISDETLTTIAFTSSDEDWDTVGGLIGTNQFELPSWVPWVSISWRGYASGLSGGTYIELDVSAGAQWYLAHTLAIPSGATEQYWTWHSGPMKLGPANWTAENIVLQIKHDGGASVDVTGDIDLIIMP
jgi:hypothetical protein